ncbi:hypothetical protein [Streptomyces sp. ICBB 8177]|uniref:hypothetical protein n=1 Tax=Streptomyces sp. ICBB 8177 TaxID=563922 RepID=UPI001F544B96|nr:hypothetical protein [Streptomyces sp. ICBB 8177]
MARATMSSGRITITRGAGTTPVALPALRERRTPSSPGGSGSGQGAGSGSGQGAGPGKDNPFAAPPKDAPARPWQPRQPDRGDGGGSEGDEGGEHSGDRGDGPRGDRWSSHQPEPGRGSGPSGPFGGGPFGGGGPGPAQQGPGRPARQQQGPRFDVTDPVQRRARYALLGGMWGLFFALFGLPQLALLLGALALYWGISALRGKAKPPAATGQAGKEGQTAKAGQADQAARERALSAGQSPAPAGQGRSAPQAGPGPYRPQFTGAVCGIVAAAVTLAIVAATFSFQLAYRNYYTCVNDALTTPARQSCSHLLPKPLRTVFGNQG